MTKVIGSSSTMAIRTFIYQIDITSGGVKSFSVTVPSTIAAIGMAAGLMNGMNPVAVATDRFAYDYRVSPVVLLDGSSGNGVGMQAVPSGGCAVYASVSETATAISVTGAVQHYEVTTMSPAPVRFTMGSMATDADPSLAIANFGGDAEIIAVWGP